MLGVTSTSIRVTGVDFAFIPVTDFVVVKRFYGNVLGLEPSKQYLAQRLVRLGDRAGPCPEGRGARIRGRSPRDDMTLHPTALSSVQGRPREACGSSWTRTLGSGLDLRHLHCR